MENNLKDKARFFAQYIYQDVVVNNGIQNKVEMLRFTSNEHYMKVSQKSFPYSCNQSIEDSCLSLKPLSKISDEDAIEVAKMFEVELATDNYSVDRYSNKVVFLDNQDSEVLIYFDSEIIVPEGNIQQPLSTLMAYDFLRSRGYLLPFDKYSIEQIISMGWCRIQQ